MRFHCFLRGVFSRSFFRQIGSRKSSRGKIDYCRPMVQVLEDRIQPAAVSWINPVGGDWDTPGNWSSGSVPGGGDDVTINLPGIAITHNQNNADAVNSLTSSDPLNFSSGSLTVAGTATFSADLSLSGGTLVAGQLQVGSGAMLTLQGGTLSDTTIASGTNTVFTDQGGTLDGVTADSDLDLATNNNASVDIVNGLTLNNAIVYLGNAAGSTAGTLTFDNTQTLGGTNGTVVFGTSASNGLSVGSFAYGSSTLTIGPGITVRGSSGGLSTFFNGAYFPSTIINEGTIAANGSGGTLAINLSSFQNQGTLAVSNGATMSVSAVAGSLGTAQVSGAGSVLAVAGSSYTVDAGLSLDTLAQSLSLSGSYTINTNLTLAAGQTLSLSGSWTLPAGDSITASGATLNLGDQSSSSTNGWSNAGTIGATNSTVNLGGLFTLAQLGTFTRSGGTVNLAGTLDNTGTTLALDATTGSWNLVGGTLKNGTYSASAGAELVFTDQGGTLNGVTADSDLDLATNAAGGQDYVQIVNGLTLNNATVYLGNAAGSTAGTLYFDNTETLGGTNGAVVFGTSIDSGTNSISVDYGSSLTIGAGITVRGSSGSLNDSSSYFSDTIINDGTIAAAGSAGTLTITVGSFQNQGTLAVSNGATMSVSAVAGSLGTAQVSGAGSVLAIAGSSYTVDAGLSLDTLAQSLSLSGSYTINTNLTLAAGQTLSLSGSWTLPAGDSITASGATLNLGDRSSSSTNGWSNAGTIGTTNSTVNLGGLFTLAQMGTFTRSGGTVHLPGTLDNTGTTLTLDATTGSWNLVGGTLKNGTYSAAAGADLVFTDHGGSLDGVTADSDLDLATNDVPYMHIVNGLTLNNATAYLGNAAGSTYCTLLFDNTETLGGTNGTVVFGTSPSNSVLVGYYGYGSSTLTIGPGITVRGSSGSLSDFSSYYFPSTIVNQGTIAADGSGGTLTINPTTFQNQGTLAVSNGGTMNVSAFSGNLGAATLGNGGTMNVSGSFTLSGQGAGVNIAPGATLNVNGNVTVNGVNTAPGATLNVNGNLTVNGSGILGQGQISVSGNLLGNTQNADEYAPGASLTLDGSGTTAQFLEVMSQDLGDTAAGFKNNFAYGSLSLGNNANAQLVDLSKNSAGAGSEALYVNNLYVAAGSTLNLNHLDVYARALQISGTVLNGQINQLAPGGSISLNSPASGFVDSSSAAILTFYGRANQEVSAVVNPGDPSNPPNPLEPTLGYAQVHLLDANGNVLASGTSAQAGDDVNLLAETLPADGTYQIVVSVPGTHSSSSGNYTIGVYDASVNNYALSLNQAVNGRLYTGFEIDHWSFAAQANTQVQFNLLDASNSATQFDLTGTNGFVGLSDASSSSGLITLPSAGTYEVTVHGQAGCLRLQPGPDFPDQSHARNSLPGKPRRQRPGRVVCRDGAASRYPPARQPGGQCQRRSERTLSPARIRAHAQRLSVPVWHPCGRRPGNPRAVRGAGNLVHPPVRQQCAGSQQFHADGLVRAGAAFEHHARSFRHQPGHRHDLDRRRFQ